MQVTVLYDHKLNEFLITHYALSPVIRNAPVASGDLEHFSKDDFCSRASVILQESMDGFHNRKYSVSELFEEFSESKRRRILNGTNCVLLTRIGDVVNVRNQADGEMICKIAYPLSQVEVTDKVISYLLGEASGHRSSTT